MVPATGCRPGRTAAAACDLSEVRTERGLEPCSLGGWSATPASEVLLSRFAGEDTLPLADYDALVEQVDED